jgi:hypothetical protein
MTREEKRIQALIERAHAVLAETGTPFVIFFPSLNFVRVCDLERPFVLLEENKQNIYTNAPIRHAQAIIEDMAEILQTARVKTLERNIENALDRRFDSGENDS